jgi:hypothetical protein|tara:strand:+ start:371 stop:529 length:159 start_codon:yes stop_codon:yes gene_type:complete
MLDRDIGRREDISHDVRSFIRPDHRSTFEDHAFGDIVSLDQDASQFESAPRK